jgi:hypothetical protein
VLKIEIYLYISIDGGIPVRRNNKKNDVDFIRLPCRLAVSL